MLGLLVAILFAQPSLSIESPDTDTGPADDTVYYSGRHVVFHAKRDEVVLMDSAWVKYRDMTVYSDSILYDIEVNRLTAHGDVLFVTGDQNYTGNLLQYDVDSRKGMMRTAWTELTEGFFGADEVWLVEEKVINARRGRYTTCEYQPPHYDFYGPRVKLLMDDIAITEPVLLRIGRLPVLAAPFWLVPVASKRKSGLMPFKVGNSSDQGWYAKDIAYYLVINDYSDATFSLDVMTEKGIQPRAEARYVVGPYANGDLQGSYIDEWDTGKRRFSALLNHSSDRFLLDTRLSARADIVSDADYTPQYAQDEIQWLRQETESSIELNRNIAGTGRLSLTASHKQDFAHDRTYTLLPRASLSLGARPLVSGWSVSPNFNFENALNTAADSADTSRDALRRLGGTAGFSGPGYSLGPAGELRIGYNLGLSETRSWHNDTAGPVSRPLANNLSLNTSQRVFGYVNTRQSMSMSQLIYIGDTTSPSTGYAATASGDLTLNRVFGVEAFGFRGIRHTVTPRLSLNYSPEVDPYGIVHAPRPLSPKTADLALNIANGFQAKRLVDSVETKQDLGRLNLGTSFNLKTDSLNPVHLDADLDPLPDLDFLTLHVHGDAIYDVYNPDAVKDYSVSTALSTTTRFWAAPFTDSARDRQRHPPQQDLKLLLSLNHSFGLDRNMVTANATLFIPGWKVTLTSFGYNFVERELANYGITVWKDLHCWEALFKLDRLGDRWEYEFEVRIRQLEEVSFGKGTLRTFFPDQ